MKISVITVSWNSARTIKETIESVLSQSYRNTEYLIIDGGSSDETMQIVNQYADRIAVRISEKDNGIYDAMNKGISLASGDVIGLLNSDDVYADSEVLSRVAEEFMKSGADAVYGDLVYTDENGRVLRYWKSSPFVPGSFRRGWHPPHPAFFVKKDVYLRYGMFRPDLKIAADIEIMLRFLEKHGISCSYIPHTLVKMRTGGKSNRSFRNILKANLETYRAFRLNGIAVSPLIILIKPLTKIIQYIRR